MEPPSEGSRQNRIRYFNHKFGLTEEDLEHMVKSPGEKHLEMLEQS